MRFMLPLLVGLLAAAAPSQPADPVQKSHIDGNLPGPNRFEAYLTRDLQKYFQERTGHPVRVTHIYLRNGPTQSGVAYPKFYLWVTVAVANKRLEEGAARIAAIDQKYFEVTHFVGLQQIKANPNALYDTFPASVAQKILSTMAR
ncbi:hypothetical protein IV102_25430 [bacterium]|nr:hypothetical protein [bacterium]